MTPAGEHSNRCVRLSQVRLDRSGEEAMTPAAGVGGEPWLGGQTPHVLGMRVHPTTCDQAVGLVLAWAKRAESRYARAPSGPTAGTRLTSLASLGPGGMGAPSRASARLAYN